MRTLFSAMALSFMSVSGALAAGGQGQLFVPCGGSFSGFVSNMKAEAQRQGHPQSAIDSFFAAAS